MSKMKEIMIEKVTLNIGVGKPGPELEKASSLLQEITGKKPVQTTTKRRIPTWSLRPGLAIGTKVTLRGKDAEEVLKRLFEALDNQLSYKKFDNEGNFAFGIKEYIDIPGMKYNLEVGIIGLEVSVTLKRPGFRVKRRALRRKRVPSRHKVSKDDAISFVKEKFGVQFIEEMGEEE